MAGCRRPQPNQAENDILKRATENVSENDGDELEQQMMAGAHELVNAIDIDSASELMHEVEDLMSMGYQANLPFERDFIAEGVAMLNGYGQDSKEGQKEGYRNGKSENPAERGDLSSL